MRQKRIKFVVVLLALWGGLAWMLWPRRTIIAKESVAKMISSAGPISTASSPDLVEAPQAEAVDPRLESTRVAEPKYLPWAVYPNVTNFGEVNLIDGVPTTFKLTSGEIATITAASDDDGGIELKMTVKGAGLSFETDVTIFQGAWLSILGLHTGHPSILGVTDTEGVPDPRYQPTNALSNQLLSDPSVGTGFAFKPIVLPNTNGLDAEATAVKSTDKGASTRTTVHAGGTLAPVPPPASNP